MTQLTPWQYQNPRAGPGDNARHPKPRSSLGVFLSYYPLFGTTLWPLMSALFSICGTFFSFGVILSEGKTMYKQFEFLAGKAAPQEFIQLLVYKAATFSDEIEQVDTVRAYHVRSFCFTH